MKLINILAWRRSDTTCAAQRERERERERERTEARPAFALYLVRL